MSVLTTAQYEKTEALGRALQLAAYDEGYATRGTLLDFYQQIAGPIADKQYLFWRDGTGDVGFICWGHLDRYSMARYTGGIWPVQHKAPGLNEKHRYVFCAISPFLHPDTLVNLLLALPQSEGIRYFVAVQGAPQHSALQELHKRVSVEG